MYVVSIILCTRQTVGTPTVKLFSLPSSPKQIKGNFSLSHPHSTDAPGYWNITVHIWTVN